MELPKGPQSGQLEVTQRRARTWKPSAGSSPEPPQVIAKQRTFSEPAPAKSSRSWVNTGCAWIVGIAVVILLVDVVVSGLGGARGAGAPTSNVSGSAPAATTVAGAPGVPLTTPIRAATPTPNVPIVQVQVGTQQNPVPAGVYYPLNDHGAQFQVRVVDVTKSASAQVQAANPLNPAPAAGEEYLLVSIEARYVKGDDNQPYHTTNGGDRYLAQSRLWGDPVISVAPDPAFAGNDIFPGAVVTGWLPPKLVPIDAMDSAVLQFQGVYFGLTQPIAPAASQELLPFPSPDAATAANAPIGSRFHPVPRGSTITVTDHGQKLQVSVSDVALDATSQVKAASMLNSNPPNGSAYVLVRIRIVYAESSGTNPYTTSDAAWLYAGNRLWGAPALSVPPHPEAGGQDVLQGAKVDGWLPGHFVPTSLEQGADLYYLGTYFALR